MRLKAMACFAVVCTAALAGCGTVGNCVNVKGKPARAIYGGVRRDALEGTNHLNEAFVGPAPSFSKVPQPPDAARDFAVKTVCAGWGAALLAVDLPLSAVADTLTLPVTVPATLLQKKPNAKGHPQPNRQAKVMKVPAPAAPTSPPTLPKPPHSSYGGQ